MCGVTGILTANDGVNADPIARMVSALRHRGPDGSGVERISAGDATCWLGSTRLAVIDLSVAGRMPMADTASDNWIVYNGEVYNFPLLRTFLLGLGDHLTSRTDTEVVLHLYRHFGIRVLDRLRGMFAFALWDSSRRMLFLARDRSGKKPLYYHQRPDGTFLFASEVRALLASGLVEPRLDRGALDVFLTNGFVVSPLTLVQNVRCLLPGHWMTVDTDGHITGPSPYWQPPQPFAGPHRITEDHLDALRDLLEDAVRLRLISDVPLGIFLSGGLDSSAILAISNRIGGDLRTFSVTLPVPGLDESRYSRQVAKLWSPSHTEVEIALDDFAKWLPDALGAMDQPTFDGINTYLVARAAKEAGLKAALSGIGADELFGGYPFFRTVPPLRVLADQVSRIPSWARAGLEHFSAASEGKLSSLAGSGKALDLLACARDSGSHDAALITAAYQVVQTLFPSWARRALTAQSLDSHESEKAWSRFGLPDEFVKFLCPELEGMDSAGQVSLLAWRLFLGERCLRDTDTMSMGVSLEVRAPFTDHVLVDQVLRLPGRGRCAGAPDKPFEQRLLEPIFKRQWPRRRKRGFILPFDQWLASSSGGALVAETLQDGSAVSALGLRPDAVHFLWREHARRPDKVPWSRVWAVFVLVHWCKRHGVRL